MSSRPTVTSLVPPKSPSRPTCSTPATRRTCSTRSATCASVDPGRAPGRSAPHPTRRAGHAPAASPGLADRPGHALHAVADVGPGAREGRRQVPARAPSRPRTPGRRSLARTSPCRPRRCRAVRPAPRRARCAGSHRARGRWSARRSPGPGPRPANDASWKPGRATGREGPPAAHVAGCRGLLVTDVVPAVQ
jgi:hypothetical protein